MLQTKSKPTFFSNIYTNVSVPTTAYKCFHVPTVPRSIYRAIKKKKNTNFGRCNILLSHPRVPPQVCFNLIGNFK